MEIYIGLGFLGLLLVGGALVFVGVFGILCLGLGWVAVLVGQLVPDGLEEALILMTVTVGFGT